jgi:lipid A oxidase
MRRFAWFSLVIALTPGAASAGFQISVYGGGNTANSSTVEVNKGGVKTEYDVDWSGNPFEAPPYWGLRGTYWADDFNLPHWGLALDYTHSKVLADLDGTAVGRDFSTLEFTDGLNLFTLNGIYEQPFTDRISAYVGLGAGVSVPHVEVRERGAPTRTFEYQIAGPAVQGLIGADFKLGYGFSAFGEYKASYTWNETSLTGGGTLDTDILVHQFAFGLTYRFGGL